MISSRKRALALISSKWMVATAAVIGLLAIPAAVVAQTTYSFSFNVIGSTYISSGSGTFTVDASNNITSGSFIIDGNSAPLVTNLPSLTASPNLPMLSSTTIGNLFYQDGTHEVSLQSSTYSYNLWSRSGVDHVDVFDQAGNNDLSGFLSMDAATETFCVGGGGCAPAPGPLPGGGLLSYALFGLAGLTLRAKLLWSGILGGFRRVLRTSQRVVSAYA